MLNTLNINFKLDKTIKRALTTELMIKSHDINVIEFHISFDGLELTADHAVKVLSVFNDTKSQTNVNCDIADGKAIYRPDTSVISQYEYVQNYVYLYHGDQSLDVRLFTYIVDSSEIDKTAIKVKTVYDQSYAELLTEFEVRLQDYKDSLPQASDLRAEVDVILNNFKVDSQNAVGYLGEVSTAVENAEASRVENEYERVQAEAERKEAETLREENYNQKVDTAIVEADVVEKVDNKVTELTPQITNLTAQLAQKAEQSDVDAFNARVDGIITTPVDGSITQQEIIDARQGEKSLGANISKLKNALDFSLTNEIVNGDFSEGSTGWYVEPNHFALHDGVFTITNTGTSNIFLWQQQKEIMKDHKYYFRLDVSNDDENVDFYIRSASVNTFGAKSSVNSIRGSNVLTTVLTAAQNDTGLRIYTQRVNSSLNSEFEVNGLLMIDLTKEFGVGNEPTVDDIDRLLGSQKNFEGTRILSQKEVIKYYNIEELPERINDLDQKTVQAKLGKNLYNPSNEDVGELETVAVGQKQTVADLGRGLISQKINIGSNRNVVFKDIRSYAVANSEDVALKSVTWVTSTETHSLTPTEIPSNSRYLWVSTYPDRNPQVEIGDVLSPYQPYGIDGLYFRGEKIIDYPISASGGGLSEELEYKLSKSLATNEELKQELKLSQDNAQSLFNIKSGQPQTLAEINLRKADKQKLILHLHNRENSGYDTLNDVYLTTANDDFSGIKITNDKGELLPYRTTFKTNDFDVISDSRLGRRSNSYVYVDSGNRMINTHERKISVSVDEGETWTPIEALASFDNVAVTLVAADDTIYFSKDGVLYRSPAPYTSYDEVLDTRGSYTETNILASSVVQHPDGEIFLGAYQLEYVTRIYRSVDNGITWEEIYNEPDKYQHIHSMYIDPYQTPVAIYAGIDGGGGILRSTDKGETWIDLREENPDMPQSTDFGVVYADPSGYRLIGGETSIQGGYSLFKTSDDVNFKPVLANGNGVYNVRKLDGKLFAGGTGTNGFKTAIVYMSEDEGETWQGVYSTSPLNDTAGASDGFRYVSSGMFAGATDEQVIVSAQSASRNPLRIVPNGAYAEIIVDVPANSSKVIVEDGYIYQNEQLIINDTKIDGETLVSFELNEGGGVIKENVNNRLYKSSFEWGEGGKKLGNFYPSLTNPSQKNAILANSLNGLEVNGFDASEGITFSFWAKMGYKRGIELVRTVAGEVLALSELSLKYNDKSAVYIYPVTLDTWDKVDIVIKANGDMVSYVNGRMRYTNTTADFRSALTAITNSETLTVLNSTNVDDSDLIQNFIIRKGEVVQEQLYQEYNSYLVDNMGE